MAHVPKVPARRARVARCYKRGARRRSRRRSRARSATSPGRAVAAPRVEEVTRTRLVNPSSIRSAVAGLVLAALALAAPALAKTRLASTPGVEKARIVFVTGTVDSLKKDFFGRTRRVAIVSVSDTGALMQNLVEDEAAGEELKRHVGEDVTARGVVLVKADGSMSLLVDAFQVRGGDGEFVAADVSRPE